MNYLKNFLYTFFILFALSKPVYAELLVYLDFKYILNNNYKYLNYSFNIKKIYFLNNYSLFNTHRIDTIVL